MGTDESSPTHALIAGKELARLRQQLRASAHLLVGYSEGLVADPAASEDPAHQRALKDIRTAARRMRRLVDDALSAPAAGVDPHAVSKLYRSLSKLGGRVCDIVGGILQGPGAALLDEGHAAELQVIRNTALGLLAADTVVAERPPAPLAAAAAAPPDARRRGDTAPVAAATADPSRAPRVLIAEDTTDARTVLKAYLKRLGYDVVDTENGRLALEKVREDPAAFDIVLTDLEMPEMDGFTLLERLKGDAATRDLPVIVISALDDMPNVVKCIERGAEDHLPKPFDQVLLKARVGAALEKKRLRDQEVDYLRRVEQVTDAAQAVEAGHYDSRSITGIGRRSDPLGRLARVFDAMVTSVKDRERRLQERVRDLQQEVRTTSRVRRSAEVEAHAASLPVGELFAERYEIAEEVGRGGMGMVYRAMDRELDEEVAVKTVLPALLELDPTLIGRFKSELRLARSISHRNVVRSYDFGQWAGTHYLTMEYVRGVTLRDLIDTRGTVSVSSTLAMGAQLADALAVAHERGVVHRDIKPQNLLLDYEGVLKVMDFGVARPLQMGEHVTAVGTVVGTPSYMAPEQLFSCSCDARADLYAAGVVLYECLTGRLPFDAPTVFALAAKVLEGDATPPLDHNPDVPPALSALVMRLLAKEPSERLATAADLADQLRQIQ